jgi:hypothetical protein
MSFLGPQWARPQGPNPFSGFVQALRRSNHGERAACQRDEENLDTGFALRNAAVAAARLSM